MKLLFCTWLALLPLFVVHAQWNARPVQALQAFRDGRYEDAVRLSTAEIAANPHSLEAYVVISQSLLRLERFEESRRYALAGRGISRYDPRLIETLGTVYFFQGHNYQAIQLFQDFINLMPQGEQVGIIYFYLGEIFIRQGRYRRADIALSTAVHFMPRTAVWWERLGYARENAGELLPAVFAYEQALALNVNLINARRGLERTRARIATW